MDISFVTGLMGSGKSKALINDKKEHPNAICFSASIDKETSSQGLIESRNGQWVPSINLSMEDSPEKLTIFIETIIEELRPERIFIDECQFLSKEAIKKLVNISNNYNIPIDFYGLALTFTGELFESSDYLYKILEDYKITYLPRICEAENCKNTALYNGRIINGKVVREGETFLEAKSSYEALCPKHYFL